MNILEIEAEVTDIAGKGTKNETHEIKWMSSENSGHARPTEANNMPVNYGSLGIRSIVLKPDD